MCRWHISEISLLRNYNKGKRSWSLPLEMLSHFSPLAPLRTIRGFALCGGRLRDAVPFGNPLLLDKL